MKIFIINQPCDVNRKKNILSQCSELKLPCEFIKAIDGRELSLDMIETVSYNYPCNALAKSEIGCALSHLNIYSKMISRSIQNALILEDDAVLSSNIKEHIVAIESVISLTTPEVYILTAVESYSKKIKKKDATGNNYYRLTNGGCGHGYIINKLAARLILDKNLPVKFEADRWTIFRDIAGIKVWCIEEPIVETSCKTHDSSTIDYERSPLAIKRRIEINKLKREIPFYQMKRISNLLISKY